MKFVCRNLNGKVYKVEKGLVKYVRQSDDGRGHYSSTYCQINLDLSTKEIWTDYLSSIGHNESVHYNDTDIINLGNASSKKFSLADLELMLKGE